jgi:photosystem II stability/assembly factor-like uncharacterized protein
MKIANPFFINSWLSSDLISIASSADGSKLVVGSQPTGASTNSGYIYTSTDAGQTWKETSAPWENWYSIASSSNGTNIFAAGYYSVWCSTNVGQSWYAYAPGPNPGVWNKVACSTNGTKLLAADLIQLYTSTNSGLNWNLTSAPSNYWRSIASSADGTKLVAGNDQHTGLIFASTNSGLTWLPTSAPSNTYWSVITSSADGTKLAACSYFGNIYNSTNSGLTWTTNSFPAYANSMTSSSDGTKLFATLYGGSGIYMGQLVVPPQNFSASIVGSGVNLQFTGAPNCAYVLQATTNLTPTFAWQPVVTNLTDANGNWSFTDTNENQYSQRFFRASQ